MSFCIPTWIEDIMNLLVWLIKSAKNKLTARSIAFNSSFNDILDFFFSKPQSVSWKFQKKLISTLFWCAINCSNIVKLGWHWIVFEKVIIVEYKIYEIELRNWCFKYTWRQIAMLVSPVTSAANFNTFLCHFLH